MAQYIDSHINPHIDALNIIVCAGSGGVGKTTISAALAVRAAQQGKNVLVLTIDPARRLANALGLESAKVNEPVPVPGQNFKGQLSAGMVDPESVFDEFIRRSAPNKEVAEKLLKNSLYRQLATTLSGSQEFTSLELLLSAKESGNYDLIILDTPPSQHAVDFLRAPEKIFALFQKSITKWFVQSGNNVGVLQGLVNRGTKTVLAALEKATGSKFVSELSDFFENMSNLQEKVSQRSIEVHRLLASDSTGFVLVTGLDEAKLKEAEDFQADLKKSGHNMALIVINRAFPEWLVEKVPNELSGQLREDFEKLLVFHDSLNSYYKQMSQRLKAAQPSEKTFPSIRLPEVEQDIVGLSGLAYLSEIIESQLQEEV